MVTQAPPITSSTTPPTDWDFDTSWFPSDIGEWEPSVELGTYLTEFDPSELESGDRVRLLQARARLASHVTASLLRDIAGVVDAYAVECRLEPTDEIVLDDAASELRAALHLTRRAADGWIHLALRLRNEFPDLLALLNSGDLDLPRVRAIDYAIFGLPDEYARNVVDAIIDDAPHLTTGQLGARIRKLIIDLEPEAAQDQYEAAVEHRSVVVYPGEANTAGVNARNLPPDRVAAISRRIDKIAKSLRTGGETRTMDQLRADVFMDLLAGTSHTTVGRGVVDIRVDLETLTGLAQRSGDLGGYGPVVADIARQTVEQNPDAEFRFMVTDRKTRQLVSHGTTRRRPTAEQRRLVEMFHLRCVFPGCRMPATQCDLDHRIEWLGNGPTTVDNLLPLCRHDHVIRHDAGWKHFIDDVGDYVWVSPLGVAYRQPPDDDQFPNAAAIDAVAPDVPAVDNGSDPMGTRAPP
ncbi:MAG: HNH endonuclease [Acidimicrobiia bacterium]|nr:HNH endonuclease [Acidimicrobiia bacterium]